MATAVKTYQQFIGGEWVDSSTGETEPDINPATEETIAVVQVSSREDADRAVAAAQKAYDEVWFDTPPKERSAMLLKLADAMDADAAELARLESIDVGKPISVSSADIPFITDNLRFFAGAARLQEGKSAGEYERGFTSMIRREPLGVTAGICPWNYPLMMTAWKIGPALAAGNTSIIKPAEITPLTALRLAELAADIFPPGVINVITGRGSVVGDQLTKHPLVRLVSVTGDTSTGKKIAAAASETVKRVHLELGGKAPVVVFDDADVKKVVETLRFAGYTNTGQDCTASCRVVAGSGIYEELLSELVPAVESIKVGPLEDESVEMGPLVSAKQRDSVEGVRRPGPGVRQGPHRRRADRRGRQGLLLQADRRRGRRPEVRDRPAGGLRAGRQRAAVHRRGPGRHLGERHRLRPRFFGVDPRRGPCGSRRPAAAVRRRVGEHALHDQPRDASRRLQGERVWQGHVHVLAGGLHADQARDVVARLARASEHRAREGRK